jgi:hypothetical protein
MRGGLGSRRLCQAFARWVYNAYLPRYTLYTLGSEYLTGSDCMHLYTFNLALGVTGLVVMAMGGRGYHTGHARAHASARD